MDDLIRIKGGSGNVPVLQDREPAYSKDEKALYIGTNGGNVRLCGENDAVMLNNHEMAIRAINNLIESINTRLNALENQSG